MSGRRDNGATEPWAPAQGGAAIGWWGRIAALVVAAALLGALVVVAGRAGWTGHSDPQPAVHFTGSLSGEYLLYLGSGSGLVVVPARLNEQGAGAQGAVFYDVLMPESSLVEGRADLDRSEDGVEVCFPAGDPLGLGGSCGVAIDDGGVLVLRGSARAESSASWEFRREVLP